MLRTSEVEASDCKTLHECHDITHIQSKLTHKLMPLCLWESIPPMTPLNGDPDRGLAAVAAHLRAATAAVYVALCQQQQQSEKISEVVVRLVNLHAGRRAVGEQVEQEEAVEPCPHIHRLA